MAGGRRGRVEAAQNLIELVFDAIETLIERGGRGLRAGAYAHERDPAAARRGGGANRLAATRPTMSGRRK